VNGIDPGQSNKLLASLPHEDFQRLIPHLSSVQLAQGAVLAEPGVDVDHAYFPLSGSVSLLVVSAMAKPSRPAPWGARAPSARCPDYSLVNGK
jgi:hypothetical protein